MPISVTCRTETRLELTGDDHDHQFGRPAAILGGLAIPVALVCASLGLPLKMTADEAGPVALVGAVPFLLLGVGLWLLRRVRPVYWFDRAANAFGCEWWDAYRLRRSERWGLGELERVELEESEGADSVWGVLGVVLAGGRRLELGSLLEYEAEVAALGAFFGDRFAFRPLRSVDPE